MTQLALLDPPAPMPFYFLAVCHRCGEHLTTVPVTDSATGQPHIGNAWHAAESWCYLAQKDHDRHGCPAAGAT